MIDHHPCFWHLCAPVAVNETLTAEQFWNIFFMDAAAEGVLAVLVAYAAVWLAKRRNAARIEP